MQYKSMLSELKDGCDKISANYYSVMREGHPRWQVGIIICDSARDRACAIRMIGDGIGAS
jgi:hypothetical protein